MSRTEFIECFGQDKGPYLWEKYLSFGRAPQELICYLDHNNIQTLHEYLQHENVKQGIGSDAVEQVSKMYAQMVEATKSQSIQD